MKPCPECQSKRVFRFKKHVDAQGAYGPDLLPKLAPGMFSAAKLLPVVCMDCGLTRFYASKEARYKLEESTHWEEA